MAFSHIKARRGVLSFCVVSYFEFEVFILIKSKTKTYVLNIGNLNTDEDAAKITEYLMSQPGIEKVDIEMSLSIVSIYYNESSMGSLNKIHENFDKLGYPVR